MNTITRITVLLVLALLALPAGATPSLANSEASAVLEQAGALHKDAVSKEGGWRETEKYMKKAKTLLENGNRKKALEMALRARELAEASVKQAESQKKNWSEPPYLK